MITENMISALQGAIPSTYATVDNDGVPNVSYISQVFYVDETHVAVSNQFFNKSMRNVMANGRATVNITNPQNFQTWYLYLKHESSEKEGELFDNMKMQLEAIASMTGMEDVFRLNSAEVFEVERVEEALFSKP